MAGNWSNTILDDNGVPTFRLVAFAELMKNLEAEDNDARSELQEKDTLLRELQHRVKNNLQMITALIRLEARNVQDGTTSAHFERLAGRVNALAVLYRSLTDEGQGGTVDLGVYLGQIASAVMTAHAVEGIRLDMKVDTWPVSIDVAMPTGLVVNELLTNSLKHAFAGRNGGQITLRSLVDETGCRVTVADNGIGLEAGKEWPKLGKLSAMIVQSLKQNAKATIEVITSPGDGVHVNMFFARAEAAPSGE
jgi:two-component sensor histidine kinase